MNSQQFLVKFSQKERNGMTEILLAKGAVFTFTILFLVLIFLVFFFLFPFKMQGGLIIFRALAVLLSCLLLYLFVYSPVEIALRGDDILVRLFRKYRRFDVKHIKSITTYYFTTWGGISTIYFRATDKSNLFFIWAPRYEKERFELFIKFVDFLKENYGDKFAVKFKT